MRAPAATVGAVLLVFVGAGGLTGRAAQPVAAPVSARVAVGGILCLVAAVALFQDPRLALTIVAIGFAAHAVTDVMHRPGLLPSDLAAQWYFVGSACLDAVVGALCYLPLLKR